MVEIHSTDYDGIERRRSLIIGQCACHLKHEAIIQKHTAELKLIDTEIKAKVSWKLFTLFVSIVVISTGFIYKEIRATSTHMESRLDIVDKSLEVTSVRGEIFEDNTKLILDEIKSVIKQIDANVHDHLEEVRRINGKSK